MVWQDLLARRDKTALYLVPAEDYRNQRELAARLSPDRIVDWAELFLSQASPTQRYLSVSAGGELDRLRAVANHSETVSCVVNTEYFLARLTTRERRDFWQGLWSDFPHTTGAIVLTVLDSQEILPDKIDLQIWKQHNRLFSVNDFSISQVNNDDDQRFSFD